jgi:hypothetical protein
VSRRVYLVSVVLLAAVAWWFWPRAGAPGLLPPLRFATQSGPAGGGAAPLPHANPNPPAPEGPPIADAPSQLADKLNSPATDIHADLRLLNEIFVTYRGAVHAQDPVGDNIDITAVLTGRNSLGFAFIPKDHPAINASGELCDRWGTPFFFHQMSGEEMEIRSAGPDHKLWTADDEVLSPNAP